MNNKLLATLTASPFFLIGCAPQGTDPGSSVNFGDDLADGYSTEANDLLAADLSDNLMNWKYTSGLPQVTTGFENNSETAGLWQLPESSEQVKLSWGIGGRNDDIETALKKCGGVCGTFEVPKNYSGTVVNGAFFNIVGNDENGKVVAADVSEWGGICIVYESDHEGSISLVSDELANENTAGYKPAAKLPKASSAVGRCFNWSHFSQGGFAARKTQIAANTNEGFTKNLARVQVNFNVSGSDNVGTFNIKAITSYIDPNAISSSSSSVYDGLNGRLMRWVGADGDYHVETGLDVGTNTSGYWFSYSDDSDGGKSKIEWPVDTGNKYSRDAIDPVVDYCGGLCGTYILDRGTLTYDPYVGVGFNVGGEDDSGFLAAVDASAWNGICVAYSSDSPIKVEMSLGDAGAAEIGYDRPYVTLPKSATGVAKCYSWSQFGNGWGSNSGPAAAEKLVALRFKIQSETGTTGTFNIMGVSSNELAEDAPVKSSSSSAVVPLSSSSSVGASSFLWTGSDVSNRIETGFDDGSNTSGYWRVMTDNVDLGNSHIIWPEEAKGLVADAVDSVVDVSVIEKCNGVCGTVELGKGALEYDPFTVIYFDVAGRSEGGPVAVDASAWGGICVNYVSSMAATLELVSDKANEDKLAEDYPFVNLPKSTSGVVKCFSWGSFKQAGWGANAGGVAVTGTEMATMLASVRFKIQGASNLSADFNIMSISDYRQNAGILASTK